MLVYAARDTGTKSKQTLRATGHMCIWGVVLKIKMGLYLGIFIGIHAVMFWYVNT
jgi:hypothetical protein